MFVLFLFVGCSFLLQNDVFAFERELGVLNFTCANSTGTRLEKLTIVEAKGDKDVLYYFWDFAAKPTFLIIQVPLLTQVDLDCSRFLKNESGSITFTRKPSFVFGVIVNKVIEFNDPEDTAVFNSSDTTIRTYNGEDFSWNVSISRRTKPLPLDAFTAVGKPLKSNTDGTLEIAVGAYTGDGSSVDPPHILHTANGSQVDIIVNNFQTVFNTSRFAVQLITLSSLTDLNYTFAIKNTPDDENTPGVFKLNTVTFERPKRYKNNKSRGYLLWRPIVYTSDKRIVTESTSSNESSITDVDSKCKLFDKTLLVALYGDNVTSLFAKSQVVSFGSRLDKFYQNTRYSCWSFVFGIGESPDPDTNSFFYLIFFCACMIASVVFAVLITLRLMKLPRFLRATSRSGSHEVLVNEQ